MVITVVKGNYMSDLEIEKIPITSFPKNDYEFEMMKKGLGKIEVMTKEEFEKRYTEELNK